MDAKQKQLENALHAAQMYYYQNLPMKTIAAELQVSHSTVSRLLSWARGQGLIEIRINDIRGRADTLEESLKLHFKIPHVQIVPVPEIAGEQAWQDRVARVAASYLNQVVESGMILGVAWGGTMNLVAANLTPKSLMGVQVVQLNGEEIVFNPSVNHAGWLVSKFANNYEGKAHLFPVPTFFDYPETKETLWRERSIQQVLDLHRQADILLFTIGSSQGQMMSATYMGNYLQESDFAEMAQEGVVGDIANIMIRQDGSYEGIPLNERACGPNLELFRRANRSICVVSGYNKLEGLRAALAGGYVTDLILDEPTAHKLLTSITS
ncbi:sugar-binding transcriptional regulator [Candidatus Leptofilum sp.]|uniref:sugar-binding transcriptional regulator n=1 Tax=Candidatus Leptofilum sp. TaxID=3241576 RepID=UPI003B5A363A